MTIPSVSPSLSTVFGQDNLKDTDLYKNLPDQDSKILLAYLEGEDKNGKPYFSRNEKIQFLKKWKMKNNIKENVPAFSMDTFKSTNVKQNEFERLLASIKDERKRHDIEQYLMMYPKIQDKIKFLEKFLLDEPGTIKEAEDIKENTIDLNSAKNGELNESFLRMFGFFVKKALERMFGTSDSQISIKGTPAQIQAFARTLESEKRYMESFRDYGLDSPQTYRTKSVRDNAISKFEKATGLKWPFKDRK